MARKLPQKRIYNISLRISSRIQFKYFRTEIAPKNEYKIMIKHCQPLIIDNSVYPSETERFPGDEPSNNYEFLYLTFGNSWYNEARDVFEYYLINKE